MIWDAMMLKWRHYNDLWISVRLVNGANSYEGRIEIMYDGQWGTVCDDFFDNTDAQVVCRQLGLTGGRAMVDCDFGEGSDPIWLDTLNCSGDEVELGLCPHDTWGYHDCSHWEDAGVVCGM